MTSSSGVAGNDGSLRKPSVLRVSGAALLRRVCVKLKMPSAYALSTGFGATLRGDSGEVGNACGPGERIEDGNWDARGVGSISSGSLPGEEVDVIVGSDARVLTEALL